MVIPAYTCDAVVEAVQLAGKEIVYHTTSLIDFNMNSVEDLPLDSDTIVIATHQYGFPCSIEAIVADCKARGAIVIEDCAASLGTECNGRKTGLFGDYAFFSFDASKMLSVPSKGGMIIGKDLEGVKAFIKNDLKLKSSSVKYKLKHIIRGLIYCVLKGKLAYRVFHYLTLQSRGRMQLVHSMSTSITQSDFYTYDFSEWQAAILLCQVKNLDKYIARRKWIYSYYIAHIKNDAVLLAGTSIDAACIRFPVQVKDKQEFYDFCVQRGVDFNFSFSHISSPECFKLEHDISDRILNIPFYYDLSREEIDHVVKTINSYKSS